MTAQVLGPIGQQAFEGRGISAETAVRFGVYTARRNAEGETVADPAGNVVVFPFVERGAVVNEKFRAPGKRFWQRAGGRRTFWNADALDDPGLVSGYLPLVITEGEIDALTAIECGFPLAVSVPDGAPAVPEGERPGELKPLDPATESSGKFEFLWNNRERLREVKRFIIAVDNDAPGQRLAAELVRRLSAARCAFVEYPEGCKDLNDVLVQHGPERVAAVLNGARPYPVQGLYRLSEYPERGQIETFSTGWPTLDNHMRVFVPSFTVVTGIPGHGKSTWLCNLFVNVAEQYGWTGAIFSPEMPVVPHLRDKLRRIRGRRHLYGIPEGSKREIDDWIGRHFVFIDHDDKDTEGEDLTVDWLLERATDAVMRDGVRMLAIDPWNEIEHARRRDESMTDYIGRSIRALKKFAQRYEVAVFVVVHPTKEVGRDGKSRPPTLYDADGSAHWFNKPDIGVVVDRPDPSTNETVIHVAKVRFDETGEKGQVRLAFDRYSNRFGLLTDA